MDAKLLLVKAITLLYLNGKLEDKQSDATHIARDVLDSVKPRDKFLNTEFGESDPVNELRETLNHMMSYPDGTEFEETELKQRFRLNAKHDEDLYLALTAAFVEEGMDQERILKSYNHQKNSLRDHHSKEKLADIIKQFYIKTNHQKGAVDYRTIVSEISESIKPYANLGTDSAGIMNHPSIVKKTDMGDVEAIADVFTAAKDELDVTGVIRTPYHGLNKMLGQHGGIRRGETVVITALTHHYKSGLCMDLFLGCALFNTPYMRDPSKKPLNLRISFENTTQQDFAHMYPKLKEAETGLKVNMAEVSVQEAAEYVMSRLSKNGYESMIVHIDPTNFTYLDLFKLIEHYQNTGYEIHLLTIDYLNMMSKAGCTNEAIGDNVRDLFRRVRNFCLRHGIALVTPHQFSSEARKVERGEPRNFVKVVTGRGYYDGCSRLEQELDLEISLHKVEFNNETYLTFQRGKHRGVVTPPSKQYTVYKFEPLGGLPFDVEGEDQSRKSIGAETQAEGGESPWFEGII